MASRQVLYFFTFSSPFAALADARIDDLVAGAGAELVPVPVVPPPSKPAEGVAELIQQAKMSYAAEDAQRWADRQGLPWNLPKARTPLDNAPATEGWYFARERGNERTYRNAVFRAHCGEGRDITDSEVLADCAEAAGLDRTDFLESLRSRRHRDEVPKALQLCVQEQVFGVPMFVVDGKRFWGNDRVEMLLEELARG